MSGITEEEKDIAFDYIILNIVLIAIEKDMVVLEKAALKLKSIHLSHLQKVHDAISQDFSKLKKVMYKRELRS